MSFEMLVGLEVSSEDMYTQYRAAMMPIFKTYGGGFRYDFKIAEVLKKETENLINRVFIIYFPDSESKDKFFADPDYKMTKEKFFVNSVIATTIIAEYNRSL